MDNSQGKTEQGSERAKQSRGEAGACSVANGANEVRHEMGRRPTVLLVATEEVRPEQKYTAMVVKESKQRRSNRGKATVLLSVIAGGGELGHRKWARDGESPSLRQT